MGLEDARVKAEEMIVGQSGESAEDSGSEAGVGLEVEGGRRNRTVLKGDSGLNKRVQVTIMSKGSGSRRETNSKRRTRRMSKVFGSMGGAVKKGMLGKRGRNDQQQVTGEVGDSSQIEGKSVRSRRKRRKASTRPIFDYEDDENAANYVGEHEEESQSKELWDVYGEDVSLDVLQREERKRSGNNKVPVTTVSRRPIHRPGCLSTSLQDRLSVLMNDSAAEKPVRKTRRANAGLPDIKDALRAVKQAASNYASILQKNSESTRSAEVTEAEKGVDSEMNLKDIDTEGVQKSTKCEDADKTPAISALEKYLESPVHTSGGRRRVCAP